MAYNSLAFAESCCLLQALFPGWSESLQKHSVAGGGLAFLRHILALWSVQGAVRAGRLSVHCPMFSLFHRLKDSSVLLYTAPGTEACPPRDGTVWPLPGHVTLARVAFTAAPAVRRGVSLRDGMNINQEDVLCLLCCCTLRAGVSPRSKGLLLRWACLCSVPDLICCTY